MTPHFPHWMLSREIGPEDMWFTVAWKNAQRNGKLSERTYKAIGPHFNSNPYDFMEDTLIWYGANVIDLPDRSFEGIRAHLTEQEIKEIVFWKDGTPQCKMKRRGYGLMQQVQK